MEGLTSAVALDKNHIIGNNNELPWRLKADLLRFKKMTIGKTVVMGRKTYESIGKPLPNRRNIIISRDPNFEAAGCEIFNDLNAVLKMNLDDAFIIGGASIYRQSLDFVDTIYLTEVDGDFAGDAYFPKLKKNDWDEISRECFEADADNEAPYCFVVLKRRK